MPVKSPDLSDTLSVGERTKMLFRLKVQRASKMKERS